MMRHPTDPEAPWRAIGTFGKLVAQGVIGPSEARAALAAAPAPGADPAGWRARREWRLADATAAWQRERGRVSYEIKRALRPLLIRYAPRAALEAAAAAADPRGALRAEERAGVLCAAVAAALAGRPSPGSLRSPPSPAAREREHRQRFFLSLSRAAGEGGAHRAAMGG